MDTKLQFDEPGLPVREVGNEALVRAYWHSRTSQERLTALELMRRRDYGMEACNRKLVRMLEVVDVPSGHVPRLQTPLSE